MQVVDVNGNMFGYDHLEIIGADGRPKTIDKGLTSVGLSMPSAFTVSNSPLTSNGTIGVTGAGNTAQYIDGTGSLQVFPTLTSADKMVTVGRNSTGSTLYKGTVIYISGSTGNRPNFVKARANTEATSAGTFGVILADIPNNSDGQAVTIGTIDSLDTRSNASHPFTNDTLSDGDTVYLSPDVAGYITNIKPHAPNHLVYVGKVVRTSPTNGTIVYRIQNGYELDEIHDVQIISVANNDLIQYDSATSLWKNRSLTDAGIQPTLVSGVNIKTVDSISVLGSGNISVGVKTVTASAPLSSSGGANPNITISQASGTDNGYLSSTDWNTFNSKQPAGNYITALSGEASGSGPGTASVTLNNASVTAKVLTGVNITGGSISASDSILTAFGKLQNQINGLIGSSVYQGTWNASTNTPALASGVGTRGYYYIVNVAGSTNLDGITDWNVGDWAIFDGTAWQQVDNTDSVTSVNGQTGAVSLTTDNIPEGATNLYFTQLRSRQSLSLTTSGTSGAATYNNTTGVLNIPQYQSVITNPVTGTGTTNYVARWTSSSNIGTGILYDTGSLVGVNTTAPSKTLDVFGDVRFQSANSRIDFTTGYNGLHDLPAGVLLSTWATANNNLGIIPSAQGTVGSKVVLGAYNGSVWRSMVEFANTSGEPNLLLVKSAGNVGIGTNTPTQKLSIVGGSSTYAQVNNGSNSIYLGQLSSYGLIQSDLDLALLSGGSERMRITSGGNVGIGITYPYEKLDIDGNIRLGNFNTPGVRYIGYANNTFANQFIAGMSIESTTVGGNYSQRLNFATHNYGIDAAVRMTITESGDIGIGTNGPAAALHINKTNGVTFGATAGNVGTLQLTTTSQGSPVSGRLLFGTDVSGWQFRIARNAGGSITDLFTIVDNGNIGIGTTTPSFKLQVEGTGFFNDYVFIANGSPLKLTSNNIYIKPELSGGFWSDLAFYTDNTEKVRITRNGSVAIGNTTPTQLVDIGASGSQKALRVRGTYNFDGAYLGSSVANGGAKIEFVAHTGFSTSSSYRIQHDRDQTSDLTFSYAGSASAYSSLSYSELMRLNANADLGLGTSSPTTINGYRVFTIDAPSGTFTEYRQNGVNVFRIGVDGNRPFLFGPTNAPMDFYTNGAFSMRLAANGNLGIATSNPIQKLHVVGNVYANGGFIGYRNDGGIGLEVNGGDMGPGTFIAKFNDYNNTSKVVINGVGDVGIGTTTPTKYMSSTETLMSIVNSNVASLYLYSSSGHLYNMSSIAGGDLFWYDVSAGSERMRLTGSGNFGIGTSNPIVPLDVNGTIRASAYSVITNVGTDQGFSADDGYGSTIFSLTRRSGNEIRFQGFGDITFFNYGNTGTEKMRITTGGNVGIGTSSPGVKLEVAGQAFVDKFQYNQAIQISGADLNGVTTAGFYAGSGMTNAPDSTGWYWVTVERHSDSGWVHQLATSYGAGNTENLMYSRVKMSGTTWTAWKKISYSTDNPTATSVYDLLPNARVDYSWVGQVIDGTWVDIFTRASNLLTSGTWMVKMYVNDYTTGGAHYDYTYSGTFTWFQGGTNQGGIPAASEIALHRMGHAANNTVLYLRTTEEAASDGGNGHFQITGNYSHFANTTINFKFVKII